MTTPRLKLVSSRGSATARALPLRRGLVCAGGGVTGAIYEIGVLAALEERLDGFSLTECDVFVGVSARLLRRDPRGQRGLAVRPLPERDPPAHVRPRPALPLPPEPRRDRLAPRLGSGHPRPLAPRLLQEPAGRDRHGPRRLVRRPPPLGLLPPRRPRDRGSPRWLSEEGRTNDFRSLGRKLRVVAVELDTGETRVFGEPGNDAVPISQAVAASCALPGFFRPVRIDGVDYIDGGVRKTAHISLALKERCGLVLCVNPIVPARYDLSRGTPPRRPRPGRAREPRPPLDPRPGLPPHAPLAAPVRPQALPAREPRHRHRPVRAEARGAPPPDAEHHADVGPDPDRRVRLPLHAPEARRRVRPPVAGLRAPRHEASPRACPSHKAPRRPEAARTGTAAS